MTPEDNHCKDCCCARSWEALEITEYTGKSIPEHIEMLKEQIRRLEDALVEERARRICHQPREDKVGHWPRYENVVVDEARAQLRAEGVIR